MILKAVCSDCGSTIEIEHGDTIDGVLVISIKPCDCSKEPIDEDETKPIPTQKSDLVVTSQTIPRAVVCKSKPLADLDLKLVDKLLDDDYGENRMR